MIFPNEVPGAVGGFTFPSTFFRSFVGKIIENKTAQNSEILKSKTSHC